MIKESQIQKFLRQLLKNEISVFEMRFVSFNTKCKKTRESAKLALMAYCKMRHINIDDLPD